MIDPDAAIGEIHLTIADLDRSLRFYQTHLGFTVHQRGDDTAGCVRWSIGCAPQASVPFETTGDGAQVHDPGGNAIVLKASPAKL